MSDHTQSRPNRGSPGRLLCACKPQDSYARQIVRTGRRLRGAIMTDQQGWEPPQQPAWEQSQQPYGGPQHYPGQPQSRQPFETGKFPPAPQPAPGRRSRKPRGRGPKIIGTIVYSLVILLIGVAIGNSSASKAGTPAAGSSPAPSTSLPATITSNNPGDSTTGADQGHELVAPSPRGEPCCPGGRARHCPGALPDVAGDLEGSAKSQHKYPIRPVRTGHYAVHKRIHRAFEFAL